MLNEQIPCPDCLSIEILEPTIIDENFKVIKEGREVLERTQFINPDCKTCNGTGFCDSTVMNNRGYYTITTITDNR